jgi:hypothetical protein
LLLLCASACAANQSALPMPPPFNPVTDSPITLGHPGYVDTSPKPERSPHKRVLPQTPETRREAGIWAAHESEPGVPGDPLILGVRLPFPPEASTNHEKWPTYACSVVASGVLDHPAHHLTAARLTDKQRRCLAAQAYQRCVNQLQPTTRLHIMHKRHASELMERWCTGVEQPPEMATLYQALDLVFPVRNTQ